MNICVQIFAWACFYFALILYIGVELLGHSSVYTHLSNCFLFFNVCIFICLSASGLSCGIQDL